MDTKILAICDVETRYAVKLMEAFCGRKNLGFRVCIFSKPDELTRYLEQGAIEILLISSRYMNEEISSKNIGKIILLTDGEMDEMFSDYESIYKYQSAEHILKKLLHFYLENVKSVTEHHLEKKGFEIYGVYSPIGRCGKSALAEAVAGKLGKIKKTLLLDLQSFSAISEQLGEEELWNLADMVYFLRQGKSSFLCKLESIVYERGGYNLILPMLSPHDLRSVTAIEWLELLERIETESDYEALVVDLGHEVHGLCQILEKCAQIYTPVMMDSDSKQKIKNFEYFLRIEKLEKVISKIRKIVLPADFDSRNAKAVMEEWTERFVML